MRTNHMKKIICLVSALFMLASCATTDTKQQSSTNTEQRCAWLSEQINQHTENSVQHITAKEYFAKECQ